MAKKSFTLALNNYFDKERPHVSRTMITDYIKSPELYKKKYIDRVIPQTISMPMQRGSLVDEVLTQGKCSFAVRQKRSCTKKKDPELYEAESRVIEEQKLMPPQKLVSQVCWQQAWDIINELKRQPFWNKNLNKAQFQVVLEGTIEGVLTCGLPDRIDPLGDNYYRMIDLKIVNPIKIDNPRKWLKNAWEMGYIHQAALYQELFTNSKNIPKENVVCCHAVAAPLEPGVSKVALYTIPQEYLDKAMLEVRDTLKKIKAKKFDPKLLSWKDAEML